MIFLYIFAAIGVLALVFVLIGVLGRSGIGNTHQLTTEQLRAAAIITGFLDEQTGTSFPGRASAVAKLVKGQPSKWAADVACGFISPAAAAVTLMHEPEETVPNSAGTGAFSFSLQEETAFWSLNNAWGRLMGGLMPRLLQERLSRYVRGLSETQTHAIATDWEAARSELCRWAEEMVDHECPDESRLSVALRSAQFGPTRKIPSDLDLTYTGTGKESPSWIKKV